MQSSVNTILTKKTILHTDADELEDEADFFDSLVIWNSLDEEVDEDDANIHALRQQAAEASRKAEELLSISTMTWYQGHCSGPIVV